MRSLRLSVAALVTSLGMLQVAASASSADEPCASCPQRLRWLAAAPRPQYQEQARSLIFTARGDLSFAGAARFPVGEQIQRASLEGLVLSRVLRATWGSAEASMQAHNSGSHAIFAEVDYGSIKPGDGAYFALAPGETVTLWTWGRTPCDTRERVCERYVLYPGTAHVRLLAATAED
jgi:hypothetical protein